MTKHRLPWFGRILLMVMLAAFCTMTVFAAGPNSDSGTANVTGTAGSYTFGYSFDSTYSGTLSSERPNVSTEGADASVSFSGNVFTMTATSSEGYNPYWSWNDLSAQNVTTITNITNNSEKTLKIGYKYEVTGDSTGSELAIGTGTLTWLPDQVISFSVKTTVTDWKTENTTTATAKFTITSCEEVVEYDLKVYPSQFGTYTYSVGSDVNGTLELGSDAYTSTATSSDIITLSVPVLDEAYANDYVFYGWSINGNVTASSEAYSAAVTMHTTIFPVVIKKGTVDASGNGPFYVNGAYYVFWKDAFFAAGASHAVVLARDYTLPATLQENGLAVSDGKYIINSESGITYKVPVNTTLLIPFDAANTLYTSSPGNSGEDTAAAVPGNPFFRTLTLEKDTHISVDGSLSLSAQHATKQGFNGLITGYLSRIAMAESSSISVNNGGNLYAWGFITGSGTVEAKSGATVYEYFQLKDWRGGTNSTSKTLKNAHVFPFSEYYIQNIEVPLTLYSGSELMGQMTVSVTGLGPQPAKFTMFSNDSDCLFRINSGTVTVDYLEDCDRTEFAMNGEVVMQSYECAVSVYTMVTGNYMFNVPNHVTLRVLDGGKLTFSCMGTVLYPGAKLIIEEGGKVTIPEGTSVHLYDVEKWGPFVSENSKYIPLDYAPGRRYTRTADKESQFLVDATIIINGTLEASAGSLLATDGGANVYSEGGGKIIINGNATGTGHMVDQNNKTLTVSDFAMTTPVLRNADGSVLQTAGNGTNTYTYTDGKWVCQTHTPGAAATCETPQTCNVCTAVITPALGHKDAGKDHTCDNGCGVYQGTHADSANDTDHVCDYGCGAVLEECKDGDDNNHNCDVCGKENVSDHIWSKATCTAPKTCSVCEVTEGEPLGHTYGDPSMVWEGTKLTVTLTCSKCADGTEDRVLSGSAEGTVKSSTTGDCKTHSTTTYTATVTLNGQDYSDKTTITGEYGDHTYGNLIEAKPEVHTKDELKASVAAHYQCSVCKGYFDEEKKQTSIESLTGKTPEHTPAEAVKENEVPASCGAAGSYDSVVYCSVEGCHKELSREKKTIDATGKHTGGEATCKTPAVCTVCLQPYGEIDSGNHKNTELRDNQEATEFEAGYTGDTYCLDCDTKIADGKVIPATHQHSYGEEWASDATGHWHECACKDTKDFAQHIPGDAATEEAAQTCIECGYEIAPKLDHVHVLSKVEAAEATCVANGNIEHYKCSGCEQLFIDENGEQVVAEVVIPATGHVDTTTTTVDATCTTEGSVTVTCSCGENISTTAIPATGHSYVEASENAWTWSESEDGGYTATVMLDCERCDDTQTVSAEVNSEYFEATETEKAKTVYTATVTWGEETYTDTKTVEVAEHEHSYEEAITKEATCVEAGEKTFTCSGCGDSYTEVIPATGEHTDSTEDKNHFCDGGCGKVMGGCSDSNKDYLCDSCGDTMYIRPSGATLLYEAMIQIRYKYTVNLTNAVEYGMWIFTGDTDEEAREAAYTFDSSVAAEIHDLELVSGNTYYGYTDGIAAKNMGDAQYMVTFVKLTDGTFRYTEPVQYSPKQYAINMVNKESTKEETKVLCNALMHYGAAHQLFTDYRTDSLMNTDLGKFTYDESVLGESVFNVDMNVVNDMKSNGATLIFTGALTYRFKYTPSGVASGKQMYAEYTVNVNKETATESVEIERLGTTTYAYYAYISGIPAKDMDSAITIRPYYLDDNGERVYGPQVVYSGYEYCRRTIQNSSDQNSVNLAKAFAMYVSAANSALDN